VLHGINFGSNLENCIGHTVQNNYSIRSFGESVIFVVMMEVVMIKKGTVVLQSCTVSLEALPGSYSEASGTSCNIADEVTGIKVEDGADTHSQPEDIPVCISCPVIKAEQDEVSYMSVCPLLDTFHHYPDKLTVLFLSPPVLSAHINNDSGKWKYVCFALFCGTQVIHFVYRECAEK
jgi:hypothetical protein